MSICVSLSDSVIKLLRSWAPNVELSNKTLKWLAEWFPPRLHYFSPKQIWRLCWSHVTWYDTSRWLQESKFVYTYSPATQKKMIFWKTSTCHSYKKILTCNKRQKIRDMFQILLFHQQDQCSDRRTSCVIKYCTIHKIVTGFSNTMVNSYWAEHQKNTKNK